MPDTAMEIITDTLQFIPYKIPFPTKTIEDHLKLSIDNIITFLSSFKLLSTPTTQQHKQLRLRDAFQHISHLLNYNQTG